MVVQTKANVIEKLLTVQLIILLLKIWGSFRC